MRQLIALVMAAACVAARYPLEGPAFAAGLSLERAPGPEHEQERELSLEGCLWSGSARGEFIVSTGAERHTAMAAPGVVLADHLNHRVHLTGALEHRALGPVFLVSGVRTLATSCEARS